METQKILGNFEPYNDIWYLNCFYHSFFPIIRHFDKDIMKLIGNNVFVYQQEVTAEVPLLKLRNQSPKTEEDILEGLGIKTDKRTSSADVIGDVIASICRESPVILFVDCYYESIKVDGYQTSHVAHTLPVYGFDTAAEEFNVIEHNFTDSLLFEKRVIPFKDVEAGFHGFREHICKNKQFPTFIGYSLADNPSAENSSTSKQDYIRNLMDNQSRYLEGIDNIQQYAALFSDLIQDQSLITEQAETIYNAFNEISIIKGIERYTASKMLNLNINRDIPFIDSTIHNLGFVKGIFAKMMYTHKYKKESLQKCAEKLPIIYEDEKKWVDYLLSAVAR